MLSIGYNCDMMYIVDQPKQCAQIYLLKNACCLKLQLLILVFVESIISLNKTLTLNKIYFDINEKINNKKLIT